MSNVYYRVGRYYRTNCITIVRTYSCVALKSTRRNALRGVIHGNIERSNDTNNLRRGNSSPCSVRKPSHPCNFLARMCATPHSTLHKVTNATNVVSSLRNEPIVAILDTLWNCCTLESGTLENSSSFFRIEITDGLIICEKYLSPVFYS